MHFFSGGVDPKVDLYKNGLDWYRTLFPEKRDSAEKSFEATPFYLFHPLAAERIAAALPNVKLIFLLRNPVERAISHYFHVQKSVQVPFSIEEAFRKEELLLPGLMEEQAYHRRAFRKHSYKARGLYAQQLNRYFRYFSEKQLLVLSFEELMKDFDSCLSKVFDFIGVDPDFSVTNRERKNVSHNRIELPEAIYQELGSYYQRPNQDLYRMLGRDFGW